MTNETVPLTENPHRVSRALHDELAALRSVRRGDHRLLLTVDDEREVVTIVRVEHRSGIYRPR